MEMIDQLLGGLFEEKTTVLTILFVVLVLGILLLIGGFKTKKKSAAAGIVSGLLGVVCILAALYFAFWTVIFGYNS